MLHLKRRRMLKALARKVPKSSRWLIQRQDLRSDGTRQVWGVVFRQLSSGSPTDSPNQAETAEELGLAVPPFAKSWLVSHAVPRDIGLPPPTGMPSLATQPTRQPALAGRTWLSTLKLSLSCSFGSAPVASIIQVYSRLSSLEVLEA